MAFKRLNLGFAYGDYCNAFPDRVKDFQGVARLLIGPATWCSTIVATSPLRSPCCGKSVFNAIRVNSSYFMVYLELT